MKNDEKEDYVMKNEKGSQNEVKEVKIKDKMEEKDKILVKKHKIKNDEEIIDEKTPKSKYKYLRKKFEDKMNETEEKTDIHPKC